MGMYTELNIGVNLNKNTPDKVIKILNYMLEWNDNDEINVINHPLFLTDRWRWMLISDSYYFDGRTDSSMTKDSISKCYELNADDVGTGIDDITIRTRWIIDKDIPIFKSEGRDYIEKLIMVGE